jgi:hypothetical protein
LFCRLFLESTKLINAPQSNSKFPKIDGYFKKQRIRKIYLHNTPKLFAKNFVSFEIMLYLQLIAKLLSGKANNVEKEKIYDRIYH